MMKIIILFSIVAIIAADSATTPPTRILDYPPAVFALERAGEECNVGGEDLGEEMSLEACANAC
jgi:hypothetical protein